MKPIIARSRKLEDYPLVRTTVLDFISKKGAELQNVEIVSGGAKTKGLTYMSVNFKPYRP